MSYENMVPLSEDLTESKSLLDIIRGLEQIHRIDKKISNGVVLAEGEWAVLQDDDTLVRPGAAALPNTYPIWAGNADGRSDVHATGKATMIQGGRFIYRTSQFDSSLVGKPVGTYFTVKNLGSDVAVPSLGDKTTEEVFGKIFKVAANGLIELEVL
jgi:hypothetical protein